MPSAMSRPSEPVEIASMSIERSLAPRRMIEPLPNILSICASACSSAFALSIAPPSTTRNSGLFVMAAHPMACAKRSQFRLMCTPFVLVGEVLCLLDRARRELGALRPCALSSRGIRGCVPQSHLAQASRRPRRSLPSHHAQRRHNAEARRSGLPAMNLGRPSYATACASSTISHVAYAARLRKLPSWWAR